VRERERESFVIQARQAAKQTQAYRDPHELRAGKGQNISQLFEPGTPVQKVVTRISMEQVAKFR
jgi:hypothetical protein